MPWGRPKKIKKLSALTGSVICLRQVIESFWVSLSSSVKWMCSYSPWRNHVRGRKFLAGNGCLVNSGYWIFTGPCFVPGTLLGFKGPQRWMRWDCWPSGMIFGKDKNSCFKIQAAFCRFKCGGIPKFLTFQTINMLQITVMTTPL